MVSLAGALEHEKPEGQRMWPSEATSPPPAVVRACSEETIAQCKQRPPGMLSHAQTKPGIN